MTFQKQLDDLIHDYLSGGADDCERGRRAFELIGVLEFERDLLMTEMVVVTRRSEKDRQEPKP